MTALYIYNSDTMSLIVKIVGESNAVCEHKAADLGYDDTDNYGWTYSPAFGFSDGLVNADVEVIHV